MWQQGKKVTVAFAVSHQWHKNMFGTDHAFYSNCDTMKSSLKVFLWKVLILIVRFHATLYCILHVCRFEKSSNENCGLLRKSLATSPQWTACSQMTTDTSFHSLRGVCTSSFCSKRKNKAEKLSGQSEAGAPHQSGTGLHNLTFDRLHRQIQVLSGQTILSFSNSLHLNMLYALYDLCLSRVWTQKTNTFPQQANSLGAQDQTDPTEN